VKDLRRLQEAGDYPPVVFVFRDSVARGERFFASEWPGVRAIADETGAWWTAFGVRRGTWWRLFGPSVVLASVRAFAKGNFFSIPGASTMLEPGTFVVTEQGEVQWSHSFDHIGDHPDFQKLARFFQA
jgi:hypothetical protein